MDSPILCDLGGTRIRFALRGAEPLDLQKIKEWPVVDFKGPGRLQNALRRYLEFAGIEARGRLLNLSLPCDVKDDHFSFDNLHPDWNFNRMDLARSFKLKDVRAWNDAEAAFYSLFEILLDRPVFEQPYRVLVPGVSVKHGRIALLGPGSGLGAVGAYLEDFNNELYWIPVPSEFGSSSAGWLNPALRLVAHKLRKNRGNRHTAILEQMQLRQDNFAPTHFQRREYLLSGPGLVRIFHTLRNSDLSGGSATDAVAIVKLALSDGEGQDSQHARRALELFCEALAQATVDFGLSITARAGIFLTGALLNGIGTAGLERFGYTAALKRDRRAGDYPDNVPIYLITHKHPELVGLARFTKPRGEVA